jgi:hypothetical protein
MGRKCTVCAHPEKTEIDRKIVGNDGSSLTIARLFGLSDDAVSRHRSHINSAIRNAQVIKSTGFHELTKAIDRLVLKVEKHLSISAKSETWFKESRELRNWISLRAKLAGRIVKDDAEGAQRREGDRYSVVFVTPDGKPAEIPFSVYRSLPAFKNGAEGAETGHLQDTSTVSDSVHAGLGES